MFGLGQLGKDKLANQSGRPGKPGAIVTTNVALAAGQVAVIAGLATGAGGAAMAMEAGPSLVEGYPPRVGASAELVLGHTCRPVDGHPAVASAGAQSSSLATAVAVQGHPLAVITDGYADLRARAGSLGHIYQLRSSINPLIDGDFVFTTTDPFMLGEDGGTVIKAANGWWVRQFAHTQTEPIELDWFQLCEGANITSLLERLRDTHGAAKHLHVRAPSVPMTLRLGFVSFAEWKTFSFLESDAAVAIKLPEPSIDNLHSLNWVQRVQDGAPVDAWEAVVEKPIMDVWSSPPVSDGIPATEVFHWGCEVLDSENESNSINIVKNIPSRATANSARWMRWRSDAENNQTKIVLYATQDPRIEYGTLSGTSDNLSEMLRFDEVSQVMIGGEKGTLTLVGGYRHDLPGRGEYSSIGVYNGVGREVQKALIYLGAAKGASSVVIQANIKDTFARGLVTKGGWSEAHANRFDTLTVSGVSSNTGHFLSYGVRILHLIDFTHQDPYLRQVLWNGKHGAESATDGAYRYGDRLATMTTNYADDVQIDNSVVGITATHGVAGLATQQSDLTWSGAGPVYQATANKGLDPVVSIWVEGAPTGRRPAASVDALSRDHDWYWDPQARKLYYYNSKTNPATYGRFAAVHRFRHAKRVNAGWSSTGAHVDFYSYGEKFDGVGSVGQDNRWIIYEYLHGDWGPDGAPWAIGGKHILHHEATNENFNTQDILTDQDWRNLGNNRWGLDISNITTNGAYSVLLVNGEAWDGISGLKQSSPYDVNRPKTWHSTSSYLTIYSLSHPSTAFRQIIGATGIYYNADINFVMKNWRVLPGGSRANVIESRLEKDNGGDYSQRIVWAGADDGSVSQWEPEAVLALHEFNGCYNWKGGTIVLQSLTGFSATYPPHTTYDRPSTGNRGRDIQLAGQLIVQGNSYNNVFENVDFGSRNPATRNVIRITGSNVELALNNITAPPGSWITIDDLSTSQVYLDGKKITQSPYFPFGAPPQRKFELISTAQGTTGLPFEPSPLPPQYLFHAHLDGDVKDSTGRFSVKSAVVNWIDHDHPLEAFGKALRGRISRWGGFDLTGYTRGITLDCLIKLYETQPGGPWLTLINLQHKDDEFVELRYNTEYKNVYLSAGLGANKAEKIVNIGMTPLKDQNFHRLTITFSPHGDRVARLYVDGALFLETNPIGGTAVWGDGTKPSRQGFGFLASYTGGNVAEGELDECAILDGIFIPAALPTVG